MYCSKEEGPALARPVVSTIENRHRSDHIALFQHDAYTDSFLKVL
jgi:hypothetical protein